MQIAPAATAHTRPTLIVYNPDDVQRLQQTLDGRRLTNYLAVTPAQLTDDINYRAEALVLVGINGTDLTLEQLQAIALTLAHASPELPSVIVAKSWVKRMLLKNHGTT